MRMSLAFRAPRRSPLLQVVKSAVATVAAWMLAAWLIQGPPPVFAAIAALLVVQPSVNQSLTKAVERSIGVIAGVVIASGLGILLGGETWVIALAIVAALLIAWALRMTSGTANQVAISTMLVLALGGTDAVYAVDRVLETLLGAALGIIVNLVIVPPLAVAPAREAVDLLADELAASLDRLADALERPTSRAAVEGVLLEARLLKPMREKAEAALGDAAESLTLNPRRTRHRADLQAAADHLDRLAPIVTQTIGMTRAFADHYEPSVSAEPAVGAIGEQLRRAAHDVRIASSGAAAEPVEETPALTAPLTVRHPSPEHWMLIGSLLEDLRRIHETLTESR
ncbi:aromatic acid exporter family protein [Microbacterium koreense]|uniref:Aromatic acid exporter family protein n=1 Tax=Microbacterium koreense TaxID=323761 RepID=A0ABW2ZTH7_9MICO